MWCSHPSWQFGPVPVDIHLIDALVTVLMRALCGQVVPHLNWTEGCLWSLSAVVFSDHAWGTGRDLGLRIHLHNIIGIKVVKHITWKDRIFPSSFWNFLFGDFSLDSDLYLHLNLTLNTALSCQGPKWLKLQPFQLLLSSYHRFYCPKITSIPNVEAGGSLHHHRDSFLSQLHGAGAVSLCGFCSLKI